MKVVCLEDGGFGRGSCAFLSPDRAARVPQNFETMTTRTN